MDLGDAGELPGGKRGRATGRSFKSPGSWVRLAVGFYLGMVLVAAGLSWAAGRPRMLVVPVGGFDHRELWTRSLAGVALAVVFAALVAEWSQGASRRSGTMADFVAALRERLPPMDRREVWLVAASSGVAEELFFRGSLLGLTGPVWSTLLFGLLHVPLDRRMAVWPAFALVVGLCLAWLTSLSGTVVPAAAAHVLINGWNLGWLAAGNGLQGRTSGLEGGV